MLKLSAPLARIHCARSTVLCSYVLFAVLPQSLSAETNTEESRNSECSALTRFSPASQLETCGATIGKILIDNRDIFDLDNPKENKRLYRLANKMNVKTRPTVIYQQLLFRSGDTFSQRILDESERILRSNHYIREATIRPVHVEDGVVDLQVETIDVWTLNIDASFGRKGGENTGGFGVTEENLFGTGILIGAGYKSGVDRDSKQFTFRNQQLGSSWVGMSASYAINSDGFTRMISIDRPFYSLDSRGAGGLSLLDDDRVVSLYDQGDAISEFRSRSKSYEAYGGWSDGIRGSWIRRYTAGFGLDENLFSTVTDGSVPSLDIPDDRRFLYPFVGLEFIQDRFEKTENIDQINRTEDRYLGSAFRAKVGFASAALGSFRDAWLLSAQAQRGFGRSSSSSLILTGDFAVRLESDSARNLVLGGGARYHNRKSGRGLLYASLLGQYGRNLDIDNQLFLGGGSGLRGYPLRYQSGDSSLIFTIEKRYFSNWYPFRLFNVGGAVFFDAGRTWGSNPLGRASLGVLKDVGFGLRIGNSRSGFGRVLHIDLAFPLDGDDRIKGPQLLIGTKQSF